MRFEAIIRFKRGGRLLHRDSRTFSRLVLARDWARELELELERPGAVEALRAPRAEQRVGEPRIFPYTADAISTAFTRACRVLWIADLRFHDLRHEATSWLFEAG